MNYYQIRTKLIAAIFIHKQQEDEYMMDEMWT